jgi:hypothetical protein
MVVYIFLQSQESREYGNKKKIHRERERERERERAGKKKLKKNKKKWVILQPPTSV